MRLYSLRKRSFHSAVMILGILFSVVIIWQTVFSHDSISEAQTKNNSQNGETAKPPKKAIKNRLGPSGLPLPRFVSLKSALVYVRRGPSSDHNIAWVYNLKGLPVEIIAEFGHWRRVRDSGGEEGWIYQSLLSGQRTAMVAPWRKEQGLVLRAKADENSNPVALVKSGVVGKVEHCDGKWCQVELDHFHGWLEQVMLWGVYPNEKVK